MKLEKKYKILLAIILIIITLLILATTLKKKDYKENSNLFTETLKENEENTIEGLIIYETSENSYLCDKQEIIYTLPKLEYSVNDYVKISYDTKIDKNKTKQDITIKNIEKIEKNLQLDSLNQDYYIKAKNLADKMTLEEIVGQLYMVHYNANSMEKIKKYHLGGLVLFGDAFKNKTKDEVIAMTNALQEQATIPLFLAVDEEGGTVIRISSNKNLSDKAFLSPRTLYKQGGFELIRSDNIKKNELLKELGLNINLAPVLDISNDKNDYIYSTSSNNNIGSNCMDH